MSYIAVLRCREQEGVVLVADTQETVNEEKQYCEKLAVSEDDEFPIAIGGAGVDEITDAFAQELIERVASAPASSARDLKTLIKTALNQVYLSDMAVSALRKQYRTGEFIVAAKVPMGQQSGSAEFPIFRVKGRRVYEVFSHAIIGYDTTHNKAELNRLYRNDLTMHQAVLLATYLVTQSKRIDTGVGGETRIALVSSLGSSFDEPSYITMLENRVKEFISLTDSLFLSCADLNVPATKMADVLELYKAAIVGLREKYLHDVAKWYVSDFNRMRTSRVPYKYLPPFVLTTMADGSTRYSEDPARLAEVKPFLDMVKKKQAEDKVGLPESRKSEEQE